MAKPLVVPAGMISGLTPGCSIHSEYTCPSPPTGAVLDKEQAAAEVVGGGDGAVRGVGHRERCWWRLMLPSALSNFCGVIAVPTGAGRGERPKDHVINGGSRDEAVLLDTDTPETHVQASAGHDLHGVVAHRCRRDTAGGDHVGGEVVLAPGLRAHPQRYWRRWSAERYGALALLQT
jgi:hypothetical protein